MVWLAAVRSVTVTEALPAASRLFVARMRVTPVVRSRSINATVPAGMALRLSCVTLTLKVTGSLKRDVELDVVRAVVVLAGSTC